MECGHGETGFHPRPFIVRYSLGDDTESSLLFKLSSFFISILHHGSCSHHTLSCQCYTHTAQCAVGVRSPLQAFFFLNLGQDPIES